MDFSTIVNLLIYPDSLIQKLLILGGNYVYISVFLIILIETGMPFFPWLPGDSMLFLLGLYAAKGILSGLLLVIMLIFSAFMGHVINYYLGRYLRPLLHSWVKSERGSNLLDQGKCYVTRYGFRAIIYCRFIPILRSIVPFACGFFSMDYSFYLGASLFGAILWVGLVLGLGYQLGTIPWIVTHVNVIIVLIVGLSLLPVAVTVAREKFKR
jgi:membrane-associated protein